MVEESTIGRSHESNFNNALGDALQLASTRWQSAPREAILVEKTDVLSGSDSARKRPDILIVDEAIPPVVIECSYESADADKDAIARLGARPQSSLLDIKTAIAVHIPEKYRQLDRRITVETLVNEDQLSYAVHQLISDTSEGAEKDWVLRRWPNQGFVFGSIRDLTSLVLAAALPREEFDRIATGIAETIKNASLALQRALPSHALQKLSQVVFQRSPLSSLRTGMVLWLNALLTHSRLNEIGLANLKTLKEHELSGSRIATWELRDSWYKILDTNWHSIFEPAINVLDLISTYVPQLVPLALHELVRCVEEIETARIGLQVNVGAELFPKLSEDRKEAAAFYTQAASAELLAHLTITPDSLSESEWASPNLFQSHVLADMACGTGALLRSGYRRIGELHEQHAKSATNMERLHIDAIESGLIGTDISPIAAHLTATSLVVLGGSSPYSESRIGWIEVGGEANATGSLEYFERDYTSDLFSTISKEGRTRGDVGAQHSIAIPKESVDWILMNPPYSRTRGGQSTFDVAGLTEIERKACQERWAQLIRNSPVNRTAGLAASFLELARRKLKQGGRIGFVLPLSAAFAESWRETRKMLETEFVDVIALVIASGKALGNAALSADTNMEEMLLVATKRHTTLSRSVEDVRRSEITCVTLREPVTRPGEASEIARATQLGYRNIQVSEDRSYPLLLGDEELGSMYKWEGNCRGDAWLSLGVVNSELEHAAKRLLEGVIDFAGVVEQLPTPISSIESVFEVGPTHHLIGHLKDNEAIGAFEFHKVKDHLDTLGSNRSLWHADAAQQKSLIVDPTHKGFASSTLSNDQIKNIQQTASRLFYARNIRWTSQSLLVAGTDNPCLGGPSWTSLACSKKNVLEAMSLWANSTLGLLTHWTQGQRTHTGRARTQIRALKRIPCPDFGQLELEALAKASHRFGLLKTKSLLPACQAHIDETRFAIDEAVFDLFGLSESTRKVIEQMRTLWCHEPSVHGWNQAAVAKLRDVE